MQIKLGAGVMIGDEIEIAVSEIGGSWVKIIFDVPREIKIERLNQGIKPTKQGE